MTKSNHNLIPATPDAGTTLTPQDVKDLHRVRTAVEILQGGGTMTAAAEALEITRQTLYAAFKNPVVMSSLADELSVLHNVEIEVIRMNWVPILANMARIASEDRGRESISAARFLWDVLKHTSQHIEEQAEGVEEQDAAALFLQEFGRPRVKKTLKATKKVKGGTVEAVVESVED